MSYKKELFSPTIGWSEMLQNTYRPTKVYKYRSFIDENEQESKYWTNEMRGNFHLSLPSAFEDSKDVYPDLTWDKIALKLDLLFKDIICDNNQRKRSIDGIIKEISEKDGGLLSPESILSNYRDKKLHIGCLTNTYNNQKMWEKYGQKGEGFCIEYDTNKNPIFQSSMLPVLYHHKKMSISDAYCKMLLYWTWNTNRIVNWPKEFVDAIKDFKSESIRKIAYQSVFIKRHKWNFENEYRLIIINEKTFLDGTEAKAEILDKSGNIDFSDCISKVYLGKNFGNNYCSEELYTKIKGIVGEKQIVKLK